MENKQRNEIAEMLVEKMIQYGSNMFLEEIVADTFVKAIQSTGMNDSDIVLVLDYAADHLSGTAREKVKHESTAIKVNNGY